jgi:hypothetical protein
MFINSRFLHNENDCYFTNKHSTFLFFPGKIYNFARKDQIEIFNKT